MGCDWPQNGDAAGANIQHRLFDRTNIGDHRLLPAGPHQQLRWVQQQASMGNARITTSQPEDRLGSQLTPHPPALGPWLDPPWPDDAQGPAPASPAPADPDQSIHRSSQGQRSPHGPMLSATPSSIPQGAQGHVDGWIAMNQSPGERFLGWTMLEAQAHQQIKTCSVRRNQTGPTTSRSAAWWDEACAVRIEPGSNCQRAATTVGGWH